MLAVDRIVEYRLFQPDKPQFHDADFYRDRDVADHLNEDGHRPRLVQACSEVKALVTGKMLSSVADWGAGNGGLLSIIPSQPRISKWGYDMSPKAVEYARNVLHLDVRQMDITKDEVRAGEVTVMTEVIEHLVEPLAVLKKLATMPVRYIVASSPAFETDTQHYEFHLWAWTEDSYPKLIESAGFKVLRHYTVGSTQFVVGEKI